MYDRFGNRRIDQVNTTTTTGVNKLNYDITQATNRVAVPSGVGATITYDNAGNMIFDSLSTAGGSANRVFDATGKMIRSYDGGQTDYVYDHGGRRVRKKTGTGEKWYIYGIQGELLAEYGENIAASSPNKELGYKSGQLLIHWENGSNVKWVVPDVLGTARMYVDYYGDLTGTYGVERYDYLPFGEELVAGVGVRTTGRGYQAAANSSTHPKGFTGQLHDNETGLDNFGARYHNAKLGRFVGVDPHDAASQVANPQGWNRYSYVRNQPTSHIDPDGMKPIRLKYRTAKGVEREIRMIASSVPANTPNRNLAVLKAIAEYYNQNEGYIYSRKQGRTIDLRHFAVAASDTALAPTSGWREQVLGVGVELVQLGSAGINSVVRGIWDYVDEHMPLLTWEPELMNQFVGFGNSAFSPEDIFSNNAGATFSMFNYDKRSNIAGRMVLYLQWYDIGTPNESKEKMWKDDEDREMELEKKRRHKRH